MPVATQNKIIWSCALSFVVGFSMAFSDRSWRTAPCGRLVAVRRPARYAAGGGGGGFGGLGGGGFGGAEPF
jgi:hypothetical protein